MDNRLTRCIYDHSPVLCQELFASVFGLRKRLIRSGKHFGKYYSFFRDARTWSRSDLEAFQDEKIETLIRYCYEHVPFYRQRMDNNKLTPADIVRVADLPKLPVLEKSDVRSAGSSLLSDAIPKKSMLSATTSGSTGYPLTNYWSLETEQREYAFSWARRKPGVKRGDSYGSFTGLQIVKADCMHPPFWRHNYAANQTCYSIFHITPQTIPLYVNEIRRRQHVYLTGYPSVIAMLGRHIVEHSLARPEGIKAVFVTSEQLLPEYRHWIEYGFNAHAYDMYGQNEKSSSITEYECGHMHYDMDYGVIEFCPYEQSEEGLPLYEMICTGFDNLASPLLRYRVGDLVARPEKDVICEHIASPVISYVYGRTSHTLVTSDGRRIGNISVIAKRCNHIEGMQCLQNEPGRLEVRVIKAKDYTSEDEINIREQFKQKMGRIDLRITYVDQLERTSSGKLLSIICRIKS
ncbi:MAG: phenylacetate--CoA ligase family protein [Planctomycetes bacterium]|nr:phenylacetate--CoA ligase family protein [Planctomycetota bacterium]